MTATAFKSHPVFEKVEQLKQILDSEDAKSKIDIDNLAFFEAFIMYVRDKLKTTISMLVQETEINNLGNEIEAGMAQINTYLGNDNTGHLTNATNNFYSALNRIRNFPFPLSKGDFDFSKTIANFEEIVKGKYLELQEVNTQLLTDLETIQADLTSKESQLTSLEKKLSDKEIEIQNVLTTYNTEFERLKSTAITEVEVEKKKFNADIEADRKIFKEHFDSVSESNKKIFDEQKLTLDTNSNEIVSNLNTRLEEAKKIVNIIGNVGVTGNYQNIANENKSSANFFRWVAISFMVVMSGLLIWSIIDLSGNDFNLYKSLVRILAAAVLTYPAIYASRESTRHRKLETRNRNLELELASIGPFIEMLPEEKKQQIKEDLVNKYFGYHSADLSDKKEDNEDVSINGLEKILKALLPIIKKG